MFYFIIATIFQKKNNNIVVGTIKIAQHFNIHIIIKYFFLFFTYSKKSLILHCQSLNIL